MPSVDTLGPSSVSPVTATGGSTSLFGGAGSSSGSGVFAALMGGAGNGLIEALDAMAGRSGVASAAATTTASSATTPATVRRKTTTVTGEETSAADLAGALAMLAGGAVSAPALHPDLASAATLGAEATTRTQAVAPAAVAAPALAANATGLPVATMVEGAAVATSQAADTIADAVAMLLGSGTDPVATDGQNPAFGDATAPSTTAATAGGATSETAAKISEPILPPALAAAIARAGVGATPEALRHLTGSRVSETAAAVTAATSASTAAGEVATTVAADGKRGTAATAVSDGAVIAVAAPAANSAKTAEKTSASVAAVRPERAVLTSGETRRVDPSVASDDSGSSASSPHRFVAAVGDEVAAASVETGTGDAAGPVSPDRRGAAPDAPLPTAAQSLDLPSTAPAVAVNEMGRAQGVTAVTATSEAAASPTRAVTLSEVGETIAARSHAGHSRFDIRLSPDELGGVDVRVEVRSSGEVRAHLVVERTETLDLMLRDQRQLERSLADAGLDVGSSGLQFSLKQQPSGDGGQGWRAYDETRNQGGETRRAASEDETAGAAASAAIAYRNTRVGGVDLRV